MSAFTSGIELSKAYVEGVEASRIMVGTGSEAVEVWPGFYDVSYNFNFPNQDELKWAPITGFDSRTDPTSPCAPSFIFSDMLVMGDNNVPTYHTRLINRQINGEVTYYEVMMGDVMNTKDRPSYLVLASNIIFSHMVVLEFGSNGTALKSVVNGVSSSPYSFSTTYDRKDRLLVEWNRTTNRVVIYKNGTLMGTHAASFPDFKVDGKMYPGFGLYSQASSWSTRLESVKIWGKTSYKKVSAASDFLSRITVPNAAYTEVARCVIPEFFGNTSIFLTGGTWNYASSTGNRYFRILVNGSVRATTADEGGFLQVTNSLAAGTVVTVEAYSASTNSSYRKVTGGVLQIGDPSLPV